MFSRLSDNIFEEILSMDRWAWTPYFALPDLEALENALSKSSFDVKEGGIDSNSMEYIISSDRKKFRLYHKTI
jgi:hypothetical protein